MRQHRIYAEIKNLPKLLKSKSKSGATTKNEKTSQDAEDEDENEGRSNPEAETRARHAAAQQGLIQELRFPWLRIVQLFDQSNDDSNHQLESPFYFTSQSWHCCLLQGLARR